jgi:hypothetical protein
MLDNFSGDKLKETAATIKAQFPHVLIEASGGITPETMGEYVSPHVDIVSQGKLTQGEKMALDAQGCRACNYQPCSRVHRLWVRRLLAQDPEGGGHRCPAVGSWSHCLKLLLAASMTQTRVRAANRTLPSQC